jgi:hypothetical protein
MTSPTTQLPPRMPMAEKERESPRTYAEIQADLRKPIPAKYSSSQLDGTK